MVSLHDVRNNLIDGKILAEKIENISDELTKLQQNINKLTGEKLKKIIGGNLFNKETAKQAWNFYQSFLSSVFAFKGFSSFEKNIGTLINDESIIPAYQFLLNDLIFFEKIKKRKQRTKQKRQSKKNQKK